MKLVPVARLWEAESNQSEIRVLGPDPPQVGAWRVPGSGDGPPPAWAPSHRTECPSQPVPLNGSAADVGAMILVAVCAAPGGPGVNCTRRRGARGRMSHTAPRRPNPGGPRGFPYTRVRSPLS